jgi:hypothetical protein
MPATQASGPRYRSGNLPAPPSARPRCAGPLGALVGLVVVVAALACSPRPVGAQCTNYEEYLHWEGHLDLQISEGSDHVAVLGPYAYLAGNNLRVIDITDPRNPQSMGSAGTPSHARDVAVQGTYAYVADDSSGLQVIDVFDPQNPQIAGSVGTSGSARDVAVSGSYAYMTGSMAGWSGTRGNGLQVLPA